MSPGILRPSRVLGLLICALIGTFIGFVVWQHQLPSYDSRQLAANQWVVALGAFTAMVGWLTSAFVTVRNSVKQHTISILLQSRLSAAYVERLATVNKVYSPLGKTGVSVAPEDFDDPEKAETLAALRYLLNHFEFVAMGIRHGDLDERLMCASLGGIIPRLYHVAAVMIERARTMDPKNFEHVEWLRNRWVNESAYDRELFFSAIGGIALGILCGYASNRFLYELVTQRIATEALRFMQP